ncbi:MAG: succinate dehydrogenase/fumarate reductase iron-sulfur subunit [Verrucomicrobiales bacterium]|nr:succinate dehydrogenase/fumarate reductase iron-sulfur subunit [Verrucomicrobiales bacterium]
MATETCKLNLSLRVWRQEGPDKAGRFETYQAKGIPDSASFLEMLDIVNEDLIESGGDPIAFDHDCREGICGMCSMVINGMPHGPKGGVTTCQLHMRSFRDGDTIWIEPFRGRAFPVIRDLATDRSAFDRIMQAGGYVSVRTGSAPEANAAPVSKPDADDAFNAASCIGCGACVAACKNSSAMLFVGAKVTHLNGLPQGKPEADRRTLAMVRQMDEEGFGNCTNQYECSAVCPKSISEDVIRQLNRHYRNAVIHELLR